MNEFVSGWLNVMWAAIWQSALLLAVVWAVCRFARQMPSRVRALLWFLVPAKLALVFLFISGIQLSVLPSKESTFALLNHRLDLLAPDVRVPAKPSHYLNVVTQDGPALTLPEPPLKSGVGLAVFGLWGLGVLVGLVGFLRQWFVANRMLRDSRPAEDDLAGMARELGVELGLRRAPVVRESAAISSPMVIGLLSPTVLVPIGFTEDLSQEEARMGIAHELAHIRRRDLPASLFPAVAQILFFFLPTVWLANRQWETEREAASDALALDVTHSTPGSYGRLLMKIVAKDSQRNLSPALGATANYHSLKERLRRMNVYSPAASRVRFGSMLAIFVGLALVLPWQLSAQGGTSEKNVVRNGGFESEEANWLRGSLPPNANVPVTISLDRQTFKTGKASLKFEKSEKRFYPVALTAQQIPYDGKAKRLKVGVWVKAQSVAKFTLAVIMSGAGDDGKIDWGAYVGDTKGATNLTDHDWKYYTSVVAIPAGIREITLALQMYGPGTVWVDDVMAQYVPDDTPVKAAVQDTSEDPDSDLKDVSNEERKVGGDARMTYFLIGKGKEPTSGYKMLLVMPGGDGSADFNPFVQRIWKAALPEGYIVCQLVAPKWSEDQFSQIVWPTNKKRWATMKFSTEQFLEAVIADAQKAVKVDPKHIYTLSWSSGGPAAYAASMNVRTIKGSFVAMSIYRPDELPPASAAKGHAYYLLHSPTDFIPIAQPRKAVDELGKAGAKITLETYEGGHGWHGDIFGMIRKGMDWLEKNSGG